MLIASLIALGPVLACSHDPAIQLGIVLPEDNPAGEILEFEDGSIGIDLILQATIVNDPVAEHLIAFHATFTDDDRLSNFHWAPLSAREVGEEVDGFDPLGRAGLFETFRFGVPDNDDGANGRGPRHRETHDWKIYALHSRVIGGFDDAPLPVDGIWNIYKLRWSTHDHSSRTVTLRTDGWDGAYVSGETCVNEIPIRPAPPFEITIGEGGCACNGPGVAQLRLVPAHESTNTTLIDFADGSVGIEFIAQVAIVGDRHSQGLVATDLHFEDTEQFPTSFSPAPLTRRDVGDDAFGLDLAQRAGLFPEFRTFAADNDSNANGYVHRGRWSVLPATLAYDPSRPSIGETFQDLYKVRWSTTDLSARTVTITCSSGHAGYFVPQEERFIQPIPVLGTPGLRLAFPGGSSNDIVAEFLADWPVLCEFDGDPTSLDMWDILAFVDAWLQRSLTADLTMDGMTDSLDVLAFLECWLTETGGL